MEAEQHFIFCTVKEREHPLHPPPLLGLNCLQPPPPPPYHSRPCFLFACDTITSRIILRFCYSAATAAAAVAALRRFLPVNVAKLMPFDYIAHHEYSEAHNYCTIHPATYFFHSNYTTHLSCRFFVPYRQIIISSRIRRRVDSCSGKFIERIVSTM